VDVIRQEREAEVFAAYFLIPEEKLNNLKRGLSSRISGHSTRVSRRILSFTALHEKKVGVLGNI